MNNSYEVLLKYKIKYETEEPVPLNDVIDALKSLEILLQNADNIISEISNVEILGHQIYVQKIETGSLVEEFVIKVIFGDQQKYDDFLRWLHQTNMRNIILGAILGGALTVGFEYLTKNNTVPQAQPTSHIENSPNAMIINFAPNTISEELKAEVNAAVKKHIQDKNEVAKQTLNFFEPLKNDNKSYVTFGEGDEKASIPVETVRQVPKKFIPRKNNRFEDLNGVSVKLRATDLDSKKTGWAGSIEGITDRVRIELDPTLEPASLYGKAHIVADVTLERDFSAKKNQLIPKRIIVRSIYEQ
ncbi:MAG: hypothetical protein HOP06_04530 [Methylotenera sp.]|nr:hypothetical protein [Methylotenera sp.]